MQPLSFQENVNLITERFKDSYVWSDRDKSRLAMFVVDALAGMSEVNQAYAAFALREAFIRKARRESSVLAGARFLGQTLNRKSGSSVLATIRNNSTQTKSIGERQRFTIGNTVFYNPDSLSIPALSNRDVVLKQGEVKTKTLELLGIDLDYPEIRLGEPGFVVSDEDIRVIVEDVGGARTVFRPHTETIFVASTEPVYIPGTSEDGDLVMLFGNGQFGKRLMPGQRIIVEYIVTTGSTGNIGSPGSRVRLDDDQDITGQTIEAALGGADEQDPNLLKAYAPHMFESHGNLIREKHWTANILNYPDVADVAVQGQRDIDPNDPSWMSVVRVCILPQSSSSWGGANPNPRSGQWERFMRWVEDKKPRHITVQRYNPEKLLVDIVLEVYVFNGQSRQAWEDTINRELKNFFRRRAGSLGRKLEPDDLSDLCKYDGEGARRPGIDYVRVLAPTRTIEPRTKLEYIVPRNVSVLIKFSERKDIR